MIVHRHPTPTLGTLRDPAASGDVPSFLRSAAPHSPRFFARGRDALDRVLSAEGVNGRALVPAYVCDAAVVPFRRNGVPVDYVEVTRDLRVDPASIREAITPETAVVMVVNYFGVPQPDIDGVRAVCDDADVLLIEDNAHGPLSSDGSALLGTRGHVGFASLWKAFPVPNGAVLFCDDERYRRGCAGTAPPPGLLTRDDLRYVARTVARGSPVAGWIADLGRGSGDAAAEGNGADRDEADDRDAHVEDGDDAQAHDDGDAMAVTPMSRLSAAVLRRTDPERVIERRRSNHAALLAASRDATGVEPLYGSLPTGACPLGFPVVADRPTELRDRMRERGVDAYVWPTLPPAVARSDGFETARDLAARVVVLPAHQGVNDGEIAVIADGLA